MKLRLRSGARPPLLETVLESAIHVGPDAKLVIEIKPGNTEVATALNRLLRSRPDLLPAVVG
jgi:hypothetical protein